MFLLVTHPLSTPAPISHWSIPKPGPRLHLNVYIFKLDADPRFAPGHLYKYLNVLIFKCLNVLIFICINIKMG